MKSYMQSSSYIWGIPSFWNATPCQNLRVNFIQLRKVKLQEALRCRFYHHIPFINFSLDFVIRLCAVLQRNGKVTLYQNQLNNYFYVCVNSKYLLSNLNFLVCPKSHACNSNMIWVKSDFVKIKSNNWNKYCWFFPLQVRPVSDDLSMFFIKFIFLRAVVSVV